MSANRSERRQNAVLLTPPPERLETDLNTDADPLLLWGRVAVEFSECWADFFRDDPECCEHNWPPLDEGEPQCLNCGLSYVEWAK